LKFKVIDWLNELISNKSKMATVTIRCNDNVLVEVPEKIIQKFTTLKNLLENKKMEKKNGADEIDNDSNEIPLKKFDSVIFNKAIQFYDLECDSSENFDKLKNHMSEVWNNFFATVNVDSELIELIKCADHLNAEKLLESTAYQIAQYIKVRTPSEIRKIFGFPEKPVENKPENKPENKQEEETDDDEEDEKVQNDQVDDQADDQDGDEHSDGDEE
jgi:hypothetical protein